MRYRGEEYCAMLPGIPPLRRRGLRIVPVGCRQGGRGPGHRRGRGLASRKRRGLHVA